MNEMSPWASRRKNIILMGVVLVLSAVSFSIFWKFWYKAPSCFDSTKNGDETGVDCGGSCALVCSDTAFKPIVRWDPRLFEVNPGLWSALVYIENPNINLDAVHVPYSFTVYGDNNNILVERKGATILPKNRMVGIFEGSITLKEGERPRRAVFEMGEKIVWRKNEIEDDGLRITHGPLLQLDSSPRVEANVKNIGLDEKKDIELVATIFDGADNAIAASRTFVEKLSKDQNAQVFFTWPAPFKLGTKACERPSDVVLLLDRSGSMASLGTNPSRPLADAKSAAASFIDQLKQNDKVSVVSFASKSKEPIELNLTSDFESAKQAVESVVIEPGATQYTNIYEALHSAWQELVSSRAEDKSLKIAILLTDGVANNPRDPSGSSEAADIKYAEGLALKESDNAKKDGLVIYTIGLGDKINESFLKSVASTESDYFFAPTAGDLESIYRDISSDICEEIPARIEITYKIFGDVL